MPTIKDVAKLAGVSTATVSRVLRNEPNVSDETMQRVLAAIEKLNYEPSLLGRNLRKQSTMFVIVVLPDITNPFFAKILRGIEDVAHSFGYTVMLCNTDNDPERELAYTNILRRNGADGVIFLTARVDSIHLLQLAAIKPVVLGCEYVRGLPLTQVSIDNYRAAFEATSHLLQLGHRRIGFINGPDNVILCRDREAGYQMALHQAGIAPDPNLCWQGEFEYEVGLRGASHMLDLPDPPSAFFCSSDVLAIGAANAVRARGLRVPEDVAIVGFDDIEFARMYRPALTTVTQPMYQIGETAMRLLVELMQRKDLSPRQVVLPHQLTIRDSSGSPRVPSQ